MTVKVQGRALRPRQQHFVPNTCPQYAPVMSDAPTPIGETEGPRTLALEPWYVDMQIYVQDFNGFTTFK